MMTSELHSILSAGLPGLFELDPEPKPDGSLYLVTPFIFDDGTMAVIFVQERDGQYVLTDRDETLGWLCQRTGGKELSPKQKYLLEKICRWELGLPQYPGELTVRCDQPEELAGAVFRLGQAMLRVSDLWFLEPASAPGITDDAAAESTGVMVRSG